MSKDTWSRGGQHSLKRLPIIIDLLYGFAIGNGLSDALKAAIIDGQDVFDWLLLLLATIMALTDWLAYHVHVSIIPYLNVRRLLLDTIFPILIYLVLLSPSLPDPTLSAAMMCTILLLYFLGGLFFILLLRLEHIAIDRAFLVYAVLCGALVGVGTIAGWSAYWADPLGVTSGQAFWLEVVADGSAALAIVAWAQYNIRCVSRSLKPARLRYARNRQARGVTTGSRARK